MTRSAAAQTLHQTHAVKHSAFPHAKFQSHRFTVKLPQVSSFLAAVDFVTVCCTAKDYLGKWNQTALQHELQKAGMNGTEAEVKRRLQTGTIDWPPLHPGHPCGLCSPTGFQQVEG